MQLTLQKIYFIFAFSYIVYFFFTVNKYKYKVLTPGFRGTNIAGIVIIIFIIIFMLLYGLKQKFVYVKSDGNTRDWKKYNSTVNYVVKKKRDLLIREALHKTYKWREYFNEYLKLLESPKSLSVEKARELVAFLYGSNFLKTADATSSDNTEIDPFIAPIIGLNDDGMIADGFKEKTMSDDNKKKLIGYLLRKIYKDDTLTYESGKDYFKDLRTNLPKKVITDRLRYFIEGSINENEEKMPMDLSLFDTVFSALGGRTVYTTELSEFNEPPMRGGSSESDSPAPRLQVRRRRSATPHRRSVPPGREDSGDSLAEIRVEGITPGVEGFSDETQREPQHTITVTPPSNIEKGIGDVDAQSRPLGPVRPIEQVIVVNEEDHDILKPPKVPHFWGYGVTQNSLYTGDPLRKPLLKALDIIKTWIPVKYEFYDADIDDNYIECEGGGLGHKLTTINYSKGTIISSRGAGFLNPERVPKKITLNNLVNNKFDSGRIIVDDFDELKKLKYIKLNKVIEFLKNIIIDLKNNHKDKKVKREELTQFIMTLMKKKNEISKGDKSYLLYLIKKQLNPDIVDAFPRITGIISEEAIPDNTILSIIKDTVGRMDKLPPTNPDEEDNTEFTNYHMTNYFKNMLDKVRTEYDKFTESESGYENYPPWLKNNSLIKMKTHRDVATNIKTTYNSRHPRIDDMFDIGEIMGDNKAGGRPHDKNKTVYLLEKLKLYNVPISNIQNGGMDPSQAGSATVDAGSAALPSLEIPQGIPNWLRQNDEYNLTYDEVKEDINIDSLNKDPGEVSSSDKQKFSLTNYNYSKEINNLMLENDYYSEFLKFTVYFGNFNLIAILLAILSYLATYKGRVINNINVTNYDKNIFNDQINKQKKYIHIFLVVFSIITIFSLKPLKKYLFLIVKIITSLFSRGGEVEDGGFVGGSNVTINPVFDHHDVVSSTPDLPPVQVSYVTIIMEKIITFFRSVIKYIGDHKWSVIISVLAICTIILLTIPSFVPKRKKKEHDITNLFVSDLKRSQKLKEGDPETKPVYEKKGNYICYNSLCTNNSSSINNKKAQVKKYNGTPSNIKKFKNLKECKSSGCETIGNSGIKAVKYSVTTI